MFETNITNNSSHIEENTMEILTVPTQASSLLQQAPYMMLSEEQAAQIQGGAGNTKKKVVGTLRYDNPYTDKVETKDDY